MGKKYLETKKGSLEEQVSLLEYYDPQYEGMTVAEVAALDEDALGVSIAQGLMKHAKKGGFKIGGKAWNSSAMLGSSILLNLFFCISDKLLNRLIVISPLATILLSISFRTA